VRRRKPTLDEKQMERFEVAGLAFHICIIRLAGHNRSLKIVAGMIRLLIQILAARRGGRDLATLKQIICGRLDLIAALQSADPLAASKCVHRHLSNSQRRRLVQFDQREREATLDVESFMNQIRAELT
jgi:DNA-binding GntR family transcriptional regulator